MSGISEQNAELSYDLLIIGASTKLAANAAEKYLPSYQIFESEDEALQTYPHLFVEQEHIPSGVVNGSKDEVGLAVSITPSEAANDTPVVVREHEATPSLTENISSPFERRTSTWSEMRAQFEDKKLPTHEFTMMVNGEEIKSISEEGGGAAVFKVNNESDVEKIFMHMTGLKELPPLKNIPKKGSLRATKLKDGTAVTLRNYSNSQLVTDEKWTFEFTKIPTSTSGRMEIKFKYD